MDKEETIEQLTQIIKENIGKSCDGIATSIYENNFRSIDDIIDLSATLAQEIIFDDSIISNMNETSAIVYFFNKFRKALLKEKGITL